MNLNIVTRGLELTPDLDLWIRHEVEVVVVGYETNVAWVVVTLICGGGPVRCSLDFGLLPHGRLRFEQIEPELPDAVRGAAHQAGTAVAAFITSMAGDGPVVVPKDPPRDV